MTDRHWQKRITENGLTTTIYLEHPHDWRQTQYALETGDRRDVQAREPTKADIEKHRRLAA